MGYQFVNINLIKVIVVNGNVINYNILCKDFLWKMQGMEFTANMLLLPQDNYDVVLGIQWLTILGDILRNFNKL